ncbi:PAS domain S-box protein [Kamptonema animale]|uniref:PAS domain S-box protein n=1 Tax=Kamptonema animale TaxID=92934 RepID=UPI002FEDF782
MFIRTTALTPAELRAAIVREPLVVSPDTTVIDAIAQMSGMRAICDTVRNGNGQLHLEARSSCVLVAQDEQLLGIVTERDMVRLSAQQRSLEHLAIAEVMASPVVTLRESAFTDIFLAIDLLQQHHIRHLPVTDEQDRLVGMITHESLRQTSRPADLLRLRLVSEVMTSKVICAPPDSSMLAIAQLMANHRVSSVMIVESSSSPTEPLRIPVGIVTERDIVQFQALALNLQTNLAQSVMSTPIFAVRTDDSLWTVQQKMEQHSIRRLAVTGEQGELLGIVTQTSLLQAINPLEIYKLAEMLEQKVVRLETEKVQLLENLLEQQVEARTAALNTKVQREKLVADLAAQIRSSLSLQTILDTTVEQVRQVLGCERVNIWQFEADWQTIAVAESTDSSLSLLGERIDDTCFKQEQAEIYRQGRVRVVTDTSTTEMSDCHREMLIRLQTRAKIIVPLLCGDELWGLLNASESQHAREWQPEEVELLQALSLHLAIALGQATTHQKLQEELTERQQAEARLRESEQRYATLAAAAPVGIFRTDDAGLCTYINDRCFEITGIAPETPIGMGWQQAVHPDDRDWVIAEWEQFIQDQQPFQLEYRFQRPDGGVTWVYGQSVAERDANGETIGYLGTVTDITDRKLAEAHLQASEERYATLVEAAPVGIFRTDAAGNCIYVNDRWCQISGLNPKTAAGKGWRQGLHPDDREAIATEWQQSIQEDRPFQLEYRFQRSDGGVTWVYGQSVAELDVEGEVIGYVGTVTDISDRKQVEVALSQLAAIVESSADAIISKTLDGTIVSWNKGAEKLFGYQAQEVIGQSILLLIPTALRNEESFILEKIQQGEVVHHYETLRQNKEGKLIDISLTVSPIKDATGKIVGASKIARDISDRKLAEAALIQSEAQSRALITAIPDLIMRIDRAGIYLEFVTTYSNFHVLGNLSEIVGSHVSASLPPEQAQKRMDFIQRALEMNSIQIYEQELYIEGKKQIEEVRIVPYSKDEVLALVRDISDRKQAEFALAASEARSRAVLAAIPDLMLRVGADLVYRELVSPYREIAIFPQDFEIAGRSIAEVLPTDLAKQQIHQLQQALQTGELQIYEQQVQVGDRIQYEEIRIIKSGDDEALFMIRDISDRKLTEAALIQSEAQSRAILAAIPDFMFRTDANGIYQGGVTPNREIDFLPVDLDTAGLAMVDIMPPEIAARHLHYLNQALQTGELQVYEQQVQIGDRFQDEEVRVVKSGEDEALFMIRDISDRKQAERQLHQLNQQLEAKVAERTQELWQVNSLQRAILDGADYSIISTDPNGIIQTFNAGAERMLGYSAAEMVGKVTPAGLHDINEVIDRAALLSIELGQNIPPGFEVFVAKARRGIVSEEEWSYIRKDGYRFPVWLSITALKDVNQQIIGFLGIAKDISDRKRAEAELQKLSDRLALSLKSGAIGCWEWDIEQNTILGDERMHELFRLAESSNSPVAYEIWANRVHPDDRISMETLLHQAVLRQAEYDTEYRIVDPDGSIHFIKANGVVIRDAQGNPHSMFGINFDISDRKEAELERQKLSERLALSLKSAAIGCWEWDIVQNAILWDERMYELYGVTKSSDSPVVYEIWANGLHPDDRLFNETLIQQAVLGEAEFDTEFRVVHPDGSIHFIKAYGVVARDAQGNPQSMIGVNFDISDRKQAEIERQQLIQELSAFKLALDHSAIVAITDIKGVITYVNDRFCEISGYSRDELLGHTHAMVNSGYHSPAFFQDLWGIISSGQIWRGEVCNRTKNGGLYWVASTIVPFLDEGGRPFQYLAIRFDITARKLAEETLQQENIFRQQIVENMAEGLCVFHEIEEFPFIRFTVWNQQMQAITGYTLEEINRLGWYQTLYLNPEAQEVAIACLLQMREGQSITAQEREIQRQDGQKRTISISTSVLSSKDEQNYTLALIQDITDRKQTEQAMTQQLAAIEAAIDGIGIMQGESYLYLNQAHLELFGYKQPEELVGKTWKGLYSPEELERFEREVFPMLERDRAWQGEAIATRKDGSTFAEGLSLTLTDDGLLICVCRDISDRKQIESQLAESEAKFRRLVEDGNDVIWSCQTDGTLVYLSPQFKTIFGWDESEWIGKPFIDLVHPEDRHLVASDHRQNLQLGKKSSNSEFRHRHRDGNYVWVRTSATPVLDAEGALVSIQGILSDISDRKQTELALQSSEIRFRRVFDSSVVGMVFADFQGHIIDANDRFLQMVGYTKEELDAGTIHWDAMTPPKYVPADIAAMEYLMEHGAIAPWEKEYYRKDGSRISVLIGAALLPGSEDQTICVLVDISDRKQAEKALQESQQFLQTVLDTIPLPLFWKNRDSVFLGCNHQLAKSLNLTLTTEIIGKTDFDLSPIEAQAIAYRASDRRVMESGEGDLGIEETLILPSGEQRLIETHKAPLLDWADNVIGVVGMFQDITDRKQAEQIIQQQAQRETLLREITGRIRKSLDLQTIFETATEEIRRFLQADRVGIFKFNRDSGFNDGEFVSESVDPEFMSVLKIRVHDRCFGEQFSELYQQGRIQATDDIQNATLSDCHKDILSQFQVRANLILPLLGGKELWGLLCIHQCSSPRHWQPTEINFIQEITNQLAIAIQQADLYEQVQSELVIRQQAEEAIALQLQRQRTLGEIVQQIRESLDIKQILATVTQQVKEILGGDRAIVFRVFGDGRGRIVEEAVSSELPILKDRHWDNEVWSPEILECYWQGKPRIVPDVMTDIWTNCLVEYSLAGQIQSKIVAPILQEVRSSENNRWISPGETNKLWGVLVVHACGEKRVWQESEAQLLQQIANQLAIAIQQASLFEQLQQELIERQQAQQQITERNQQLAISNEELARATRLKDEFLANMSHELRTPLNAILGMTEGLQEGVFGIVNDPQIKALETIERSGTHLLELINDILDVAKIESGQMELEYTSVSISRLCQSSLAFIKQQALKKRLQLEIKLPANVPDLLIDERRIRQVLINLLNNAVKFTPEGGRITLEVSHQRRATVLAAFPLKGITKVRVYQTPFEQELGLKSQEQGLEIKDYLRIAIIDTGIGIAPENINKLFQPFIQIDSALNRQYDGTGLGLALVKRIVELHGGQVGLTSKVGSGSCFTIDLPSTAGALFSADPSSAELSSFEGESQSSSSLKPNEAQQKASPLILLAEDNEANISTVSSYLKAKGYRIVLAKNGEEAIALAKSENPNLILMDIQMPGMDGLEAMQQIRLDPSLVKVPIIALTALAMSSDRDRCLAAGANDYISKPVKLKQLAATIQQLLAPQ